jgi:hypothetical protein
MNNYFLQKLLTNIMYGIPPLVQKEEEEEDGDAVVEIEGLGWKLSSRRTSPLTLVLR